MTTFLLIRHAHTVINGTGLAGRAPGHSLSAEGGTQAQRLAQWLQPISLDAVYSSPMTRARQTARAIAETHQLPVQIHARFNEIDYGAWTGKTFTSLQEDVQWWRWNHLRSLSRPTEGESMLKAQARALDALFALYQRHPSGNIAIVSHADMIKSVLSYLLGTPLDLFERIEIAPASVSVVRLYEDAVSVLCLNCTSELTL